VTAVNYCLRLFLIIRFPLLARRTHHLRQWNRSLILAYKSATPLEALLVALSGSPCSNYHFHLHLINIPLTATVTSSCCSRVDSSVVHPVLLVVLYDASCCLLLCTSADFFFLQLLSHFSPFPIHRCYA